MTRGARMQARGCAWPLARDDCVEGTSTHREATGAVVGCRVGDRQVSITFGHMITRAQLIDVLFVIVPHSLLQDIAGPAEAFRLANQHRERSGLPPRFRLRFAAPSESQVTSVGLSIAGLEPLPQEL